MWLGSATDLKKELKKIDAFSVRMNHYEFQKTGLKMAMAKSAKPPTALGLEFYAEAFDLAMQVRAL